MIRQSLKVRQKLMGNYSAYTSSIHYDWRLYREDIAGSVAHAKMLAKQGVITKAESDQLLNGLLLIQQEIEAGEFPWREELEDLHMNIESRLHEHVGNVAGKLHTARSRNDQIATDTRLFTKEAISQIISHIRDLQGALLAQAETNLGVLLPGYTHLQRAQPVLLSHHLLAYYNMLERDQDRFALAYVHTDVLPLGSGALAGSPYPLDREEVAKELGFSRISENSMDAVSDRDFLLDSTYAAAACMTHLSRLAEELVLWSSQEFGFIRLADHYTTGSSIMPQKRNPDFAELARGRTGQIYGHLVALLTVLKGLPLTYSRDLQEDKEGFFQTVDTLQSTLTVFTGMVSTLQVDTQQMRAALQEGYLLATDLADYLVSKGMAFRKAHTVVAELCHHAYGQGKTFEELNMDEYLRFSKLFEKDVFNITPESSVEARDVPGGTAPRRVEQALRLAKKTLEAGKANDPKPQRC